MRRLAAVLGVLGVLTAASCGSVPKTYYYTLRLPPVPAAGDPKTTFALGVEHFRAAEVLRDDRIVYYRSPTELDFYQYHRWSADPATLVTERAARWLGQMGVFADVRLLPSREPVDYVLKGRVLNFEEVDDNQGGKGRAALALELVRSHDRRVVWSFTRQSEHAIEGKGMSGVVDALDASTQDLLGQALTGLTQQVEHDFAEKK